MKKWKWLAIILIGVFFVKNAIHYGTIVYQNQNFNQIFGFVTILTIIGFIYVHISKIILNS